MTEKVTRGNGFLEGILAKKRTTMANSLIPDGLRLGRILDVGCGTSPYFLKNIEFQEKYGVDRISETSTDALDNSGIVIKNFDLELGHRLPFDDNYFDVVAMLAVLEHLEADTIERIIKEVRRVIKKGGVFIGTTPVWWADSILRIMARLRLVSSEEIDEHKTFFTRDKLHDMISAGGFTEEITTGSFEGGVNLWFVVQKSINSLYPQKETIYSD